MNKYLKLDYWLKEKPIVFICFFCFTLRLIFCFFIFPTYGLPLIDSVDIDNFDTIAKNLLHGYGFVIWPGWYPNLYRAPLYIILLFFIYLIFGESLIIVQFIQSLIGAITCFIIYIIANKTFNKKTAIISAIIFSLYPLFIWYTARIWMETFFTFLVGLLVLFLTKFFMSQTKKNAFFLGFMLGIVNLCKSILLYLPLFLLATLLMLFWHKKKETILNSLIIIITMLLVISPWTYRNYLVSHHFIAVQESGIGMIGGDLIAEEGIGIRVFRLTAIREAEQVFDTIIKEKESEIGKEINKYDQDAIVLSYLSHKYLSSPLFFLKRTLMQLLTFWYLGASKWRSLLFAIMQFSLLLPGLFGLIYAIKNKIFILPLLSIIIYFMLIHSLSTAVARYSIPIMPYVGMFAAYAITVKLEKRYKI